ncbi:hypothetical protein L226DRAFT_474469, partial [Lentinus tigrinus ALCF2SS1-7]|uniref:uncharacterized protein n=1 Tax=Lentinus tigrinus ALCF2SS1-7 TaxID=1328758 RepID=UPI001165DAEC
MNASGQAAHPPVIIPQAQLCWFADTLRAKLADHPRLSEPFFMIEINGPAMYLDTDINEIQEAYEEWLDVIDFAAAGSLDDWYGDIGYEVSDDGFVLQWRTDGHRKMLAALLPSDAENAVNSIMARWEQYHVLETNHLFGLAGFTATPGPLGAQDGVHCISAFAQEHVIPMMVGRHAGTPHAASELAPGSMPQLLEAVDKLAAAFADCASGQDPQDVTARLELRVDVRRVMDVIGRVRMACVQRSIVLIPTASWWYIKWYRILSCRFILQKMAMVPPAGRMLTHSLRLGAGIIDVLNATMGR